MARLSRYLLRLFSSEAASLFAVAAFMLFLIQCLRLFDIVENKGQSFLTLLGQAALGMPALGIVFLYVCLGIGLGRALRNLQAASELQIIHVSGLVPALLRAVALYTILGTLILLVLAHIVDPLSIRAANGWSANIAADLVSRSMVPHRFTEVVSGVQLDIGARDSQGNITDFFADDHRDPDSRRTYFAKSAIITRDEQGYVLRMQDGAVQYLTADKRFSQVSFTRYDLTLDSLTGGFDSGDSLSQTSSLDLIGAALVSGQWSDATVQTLFRRSTEAFRAIAMCLFVTGLAAFPTGSRRRFEVPIELLVLGAAFIERAVTAYVPGLTVFGIASGTLLLLILGALILLRKLRVFSFVRPPRRQAA